MQQTTSINADQRNGNLHINLEGQFTLDIAAQLALIMSKKYMGKGNIFIHTEKISTVAPNSSYAFHRLLEVSGLPKDNVYLTGQTGLEICHDTDKVIISKKRKHGHGSCGKCKNCSCHKRSTA